VVYEIKWNNWSKTGTRRNMSHIVLIENDRTLAVLITKASRQSKSAEFVRRPGLLLALCLYAAFLNLSFFDTLRHCLKFVRLYEIVRQCLIHWDSVSCIETVSHCSLRQCLIFETMFQSLNSDGTGNWFCLCSV
jgi:hypothetical protein